MSDCISKDEILSPDDYGFLYGQLECNKIPADIYDKIMEGDEFTEEEERRIKDIIEKEKAKIQEERKKGIKECWCDSCEYCEGYLHKTRKSLYVIIRTTNILESILKNIIYERWKVLLDLEKNSLIFPKIKQPQDGVRKIVLKGY